MFKFLCVILLLASCGDNYVKRIDNSAERMANEFEDNKENFDGVNKNISSMEGEIELIAKSLAALEKLVLEFQRLADEKKIDTALDDFHNLAKTAQKIDVLMDALMKYLNTQSNEVIVVDDELNEDDIIIDEEIPCDVQADENCPIVEETVI